MNWWIALYLIELAKWSFTRLRIHQAIVALIVSLILFAGRFLGITGLSTLPQFIATWLVIWFVILMFIVAPAYTWRQQADKLRPLLAFVDWEDNKAVYPSGYQYARVTVKNCSARLLTNVQVKLVCIDPRPPDFVTLNVPLSLMHASDYHEAQCSLQPDMPQSFDLLYLNVMDFDKDATQDFHAVITHAVNSVPRKLPFDTYRIKLVASANETVPTEQWVKVTVKPGLQIRREK